MPDTLGYRKILGVLVPYFNTVVEPELGALRPEGVSNQTARFTLDAKVLENVAETATQLLSCGPAALIVGLATESFANGLAVLAQGAEDLAKRTGLPIITASHATHAALRQLEARRIAVLTPFDDPANTHVRAAFEANGFEVVGIHGLACPGLDTIAQCTSDEIREGFRRADHADAEALVQVGTGLPVLHLVDELEGELHKPIVACNAAAYWQALRETGIDDKVRGFGRLLAEH